MILANNYAYLLGKAVVSGVSIAHNAKGPETAIDGFSGIISSSTTFGLLADTDFVLQDDTAAVVSTINESATDTTAFTEDTGSFMFPHSSTNSNTISFWLNRLTAIVDSGESTTIDIKLT